MAKTQTFGDKLKKGGKADGLNVRVIQGYKSDEGSYKFQERFVRVNDLSEVTKIDLRK